MIVFNEKKKQKIQVGEGNRKNLNLDTGIIIRKPQLVQEPVDNLAV